MICINLNSLFHFCQWKFFSIWERRQEYALMFLFTARIRRFVEAERAPGLTKPATAQDQKAAFSQSETNSHLRFKEKQKKT